MFGIGIGELTIILVIVLIIFGAGKLPEIGNSLGKCIKNFKEGVSGEEKIEKLPERKEIDNQKTIEHKS